jgi:ABC-type Na+ efflux pump permease subunit
MVLGAGLISDELENGHAQLVLLRPITRAEWFGGRFAGAALVLLGAQVVAWLAGLGGLLRAGKPDAAWALSLPLAYVEALGWLAILAALSVVLRRSMNVGLLLFLALFYAFMTVTMPLVLGKPQWVQVLRDAGRYLGPMELRDILKGLSGPRREVWPLFYDLTWLFGAWLAGVLLLDRREVARRRV